MVYKPTFPNQNQPKPTKPNQLTNQNQLILTKNNQAQPIDQPKPTNTNQKQPIYQPTNQDQPTDHPANQPAGVDTVDAIVHGRPAHSHSSIVLKANQIISVIRELWQGHIKISLGNTLKVKGKVQKFGLLLQRGLGRELFF